MLALENELELYVEDLYRNQNIGADSNQRNLMSKEAFEFLMRPVINVIRDNRDASLDEIRRILYRNSGIEEVAKSLIYDKGAAPGMMISYGTKHFMETLIAGANREVSLDVSGKIVDDMNQIFLPNTIFDIASITKLFTSLSILKLEEFGVISLDDKITRYVPEFRGLEGISILDLLTFQVPLKTKRIDQSIDFEEAKRALLDIKVDTSSNVARPYSDMGAMVLKYVIENASGQKYSDFLDYYILKPLGIEDVYSNVKDNKRLLKRVASTGYDYRYAVGTNGSEELILNKSVACGDVYDGKARILSEDGLSGHAGLFATTESMIKLSRALMSGAILEPNAVGNIGKNRTGRILSTDIDNTRNYSQFLGALVHSKHPILNFSEVHHILSGSTIGMSGWTGMQLTIDPVNEVTSFLASNRSHNRVTSIDSSIAKKVLVDSRGRRLVRLADGTEKIDSTGFVYQRDRLSHKSLELALQYRFLERIEALENNKVHSLVINRLV